MTDKNKTESIFSKGVKPTYREPATDVDFEAFKRVVESRRSVRVYTKDPIPPEVMRECLRLTLLAPNSSNLQPWEFLWIRNKEIREKLNVACFGQPAATTAAELVVCVARTGTWRAHAGEILKQLQADPSTPKQALDYYKKLVPMVYTQGPLGSLAFLRKIAFSVVGLWKVVPREPHSPARLREWAVKSTALACENLMLSLRAAGFDSCPMEGFDSARVRRALQLPSDATVVMIVSSGRRADSGVYTPRMRLPSSEFIREIN